MNLSRRPSIERERAGPRTESVGGKHSARRNERAYQSNKRSSSFQDPLVNPSRRRRRPASPEPRGASGLQRLLLFEPSRATLDVDSEIWIQHFQRHSLSDRDEGTPYVQHISNTYSNTPDSQDYTARPTQSESIHRHPGRRRLTLQHKEIRPNPSHYP